MSKFVAEGAKLKCTQGAAVSSLTVLTNQLVKSEGKKIATIFDFTPKVCISGFGQCAILSAAATAAAQGVPQNIPCLAAITAPWAPGSIKTKISGKPALTKDSKAMCLTGGVISIIYPGQNKVDGI